MGVEDAPEVKEDMVVAPVGCEDNIDPVVAVVDVFCEFKNGKVPEVEAKPDAPFVLSPAFELLKENEDATLAISEPTALKGLKLLVPGG